MINGIPLDQKHIGYKTLRPKDAQNFIRIKNKLNYGDDLSVEE